MHKTQLPSLHYSPGMPLSARFTSRSHAEQAAALGWTYLVKFDLFHNARLDFHRAPLYAIGFQLSSHEASNISKRWIRLATF